MPKQPPKHSAQRERPMRERYCWSKCRMGGTCESCFWEGDRFKRHGGTCEKCGGQMRCSSTAKMANGRCRMHGGGLKNRGAANENYRGGRYAALNIPADMAQRILEAESAEDLLSLAPDVALVEEQIKQVVEEQGELAGYASAKQALKLLDDADKLLAAGETEGVQKVHRQLREILDPHELIAENRREVARLLDCKRKLVESQRKSLLEQGELIETVRAIALLDQLLKVFTGQLQQGEVDESKQAFILEGVSREFARLTNQPRDRTITGDDDRDP